MSGFPLGVLLILWGKNIDNSMSTASLGDLELLPSWDVSPSGAVWSLQRHLASLAVSLMELAVKVNLFHSLNFASFIERLYALRASTKSCRAPDVFSDVHIFSRERTCFLSSASWCDHHLFALSFVSLMVLGCRGHFSFIALIM